MESKSGTCDRRPVEQSDFVAASRRVLHLANFGPGRIEFLREASRLLLDFSGCDALELYVDLRDGGPRYRWSATRTPRESFKFDFLREEPAIADSAASPNGTTPALPPMAWLDGLVQELLLRRFGPRSRCVTAHGSFWTGDAAADLALSEVTRSWPRDGHLHIGSVAVIPFDVTPASPAVMVLLSGRKHVFDAQSIESYEALAQTLGVAIDDRRAQHALRERVKELCCLYAIARVLEDAEDRIAETLSQIARLLPPAWQFPDATIAQIRVDDEACATGDMAGTSRRLEEPIVIGGKIRGAVEVGYVGDRPEFAEGVFLKEERHLIAAVAREVSLYIEKCEAREEKRRLAEQILQTDRLATIGQLAAGIAHEINEPLGSVLGFSQLARKAAGLPAGVAADLDKIIQAALHAREIVRKLMLFARQSPPTRSCVRINEIVDESLTLLAPRFADHSVQVIRDLEPANPTISADAVQLNQVVVNLCVNAIHAMPPGGTLTIRTCGTPDSIILSVEDTGAGIPADVADHVFEPFFTTKSPQRGTGLGLSVVHGIVTSHGGTIRFDTKPGAGTRFEVRLPLAPPSCGDKGKRNHE